MNAAEIPTRHARIDNWSIDKVCGVSVLSGTVVWPNQDQRRPPHAREIRMELLWWSANVFGCHDGKDLFRGSTHHFNQGDPATDPYPYLTKLFAVRHAIVRQIVASSSRS
jgi:hypothetical protein